MPSKMKKMPTLPLTRAFSPGSPAGGPPAERRDLVDVALETWKREFPNMDVTTEGLVSRIHKISRYIDKALSETAQEFGLTVGDWELLSCLRRQGPPYKCSPSELSRDLMLSSGAMTNRLDKLEEQGLIARHPDPSDRRGVQVELTTKGRDIWSEAVDMQAAKEKFFADALTDEEKDLTNDLLRKMLLAFRSKGPYPRRVELSKKYDE
jgi:DNA-binding MarR family transcriptional regulator